MKIPRPELVQEMILKNGVAVMRFYGSSMNPFIKEGCRVVVEAVQNQPVAIGDIVCFRSDSRLVAHRVVSKLRSNGIEHILTKGDNCSKLDAPVTPGEIVGRIVRVEGRSLTGRRQRAINFCLAKLSWASNIAAQSGNKLKRAVLFKLRRLVSFIFHFF